MAALELGATPLLTRTLACTAKVGVHEGGSSSSKTVSLAQAHIVWSFQEPGKVFSIVRETMPAMKRGALRDFQNALRWAGVEDRFAVNRTDFVYTNLQTGTQVEFFALDDEQKARGPRRDRLWINEANGTTYESFRQLSMRTRGPIWLDYNPSMQRSWIYDHVLTRADCELIHSTYRDNGYLTAENRREIEIDVPVYEEADGRHTVDWDLTYKGRGALIKGDPYRWAVFGLGRRGAPSEAIYPYVHTGSFPAADTVLGLDFGYNHPLVLCRLARVDREGKPALHIDQLIHESFLTTDDLLLKLPEAGVEKWELIYADGSRPETIQAMKTAGYNVQAADKSKGSVYQGIQFVKGHRLVFTARSERSRAQFEDYRWKKLPDDTVSDEPVKLNDDAPDAVRYGAFTYWGSRTPATSSGAVFIRDN